MEAGLPYDDDTGEHTWDDDPTVDLVYEVPSAGQEKGIVIENRTEGSWGSGASSRPLPQRDHIHRVRRMRGLQDAGDERLRRCLQGVHTQMLLNVVSTFGVIDMRTALALCQCIGGATCRYYSMRVTALTRAQVLHRVHSADLNLGNLLGRSFVLVAGDAWPKAVEILGVDSAAAMWGGVRRGLLMEQLAFTHFVIDRVLSGWTVLRGEQWLDALARLDRSRYLGARQQSVTEALRTGRVRFANPSDVLGLIPPTDAGRPVLMVGEGAIPPSKIRAILRTVRRIAPLEVVCFRRNNASVEWIRRLVMATLGGVGVSTVTVLPSSAGVRWRKTRQELLARIECTDGPGTDMAAPNVLARHIQNRGMAFSS